MANLVTNKCKYELFTGDANLDAADMRVLLLKSGTPLQTTNFVSDLTPASNEVTVSGYARYTLTSESVTEDDTNHFAYLDAEDAAFGALTTGETITWAILFRHTGSDATAPVYGCYDVADTPTNGGTVTVVWNTPANGGVLKGA